MTFRDFASYLCITRGEVGDLNIWIYVEDRLYKYDSLFRAVQDHGDRLLDMDAGCACEIDDDVTVFWLQ